MPFMEFCQKRMAPLAAWVALALLIFSARAADDANHKNILILGDSLSAGYGVDPDQAWPALLQKKIDSAEAKATVINAGVSGDTSADGLRRLDWLLQRKIDILILELGGNDGLRGTPIATTIANLQSIIDHTRKKLPEIKIVIAGMKMPPNLGAEFVDAFDKIYPEIAAKNHAVLIPFLLEGVGGDPKLNLPDGIHPTPEGHKIVAENVWKILQPMLP